MGVYSVAHVPSHVRGHRCVWVSLSYAAAYAMAIGIILLGIHGGLLRLPLIHHMRKSTMGWRHVSARTPKHAAGYCCCATIARLTFPAFSPDGDVLWIETHELVYVDERVISGGAVNVGDLLTIGVHRVTGDGRTV